MGRRQLIQEQKWVRAHATIGLLAKSFPKCFAVFAQRRKPLKLGIHKDILERLADVVSADDVMWALRFYCGHKVYRSRLVAGAWRYDLDGNVAGAVTKDEETPRTAARPAAANRGDGFAAPRMAYRARQAAGGGR